MSEVCIQLKETSVMVENSQSKVDSDPKDETSSADELRPADKLDRRMRTLGLYSLPLKPPSSVPEPQ